MEITTIGLDVARVAEIAVRLVALRVGGPAAIEADHAQKRQFIRHHGVELHRVLSEGPPSTWWTRGTCGDGSG